MEEELLLQIRLKRKALKLSQAAIAEKLHVSTKAYQNIEHGYTRIDLVRLRDLASILDLDIQKLLFPNSIQDQVSSQDYNKLQEDYQRIIRDKESYISILEDKLNYYRNVLKEQDYL